MNVFETLLGEIEEADRASLKEIASRNPKLNGYLAEPADIEQVERVRNWQVKYWDFEHNCTHLEHERKLRVDALEQQIAALPANEGENVTFKEIEAFLDEKIKAGVVISPALVKDEIGKAVKAKEDEITYSMNRMANLATVVPYLNQLHQRDLGELFDPEDLLTRANADYQETLKVNPNAQPRDLKDFYLNKYSVEARTAKATAQAAADKTARDAELAAARLAGKQEALQERVGTEGGPNPSLDNGPDIGHFQQRLMAKNAALAGTGDGKSDLEKVPMGNGSIAAIRAREGDRREIAGHAA